MGRWWAVFLILLILPLGHALSDEQRLATLAANMLSTTSGDYAIECGPIADNDHKPDLLNQLPMGNAYGDYYCVLTQGGKITFGTFGNEQDILQSFKDAAFDRQQLSIDADACSGLAPSDDFQECPGAITGKYPLHVYAYNAQPSDETTYVIVSESSISGFKGAGFISQFADWIAGFFTTPDTFLSSEDAFHHAYYTHQAGKNVTATWKDASATFIYQNFANDFSKTRPAGSTYTLGHRNRQILELALTRGNTQDINTWRKYTTNLKIAAGGTPIVGDTCGDGKVSFDEECEPGLAMPSCQSVFANYDGGMLGCHAKGSVAECTWDTGSCVSCQDADNDHYTSGVGVSDSMSFATPVRVMTTEPSKFGTYIVPIPYDLAAPAGSAADTAFSQAMGKITTDADVTEENIASARSAMMSSLLNTYNAARPCTLGEKRSCPDGYWPAVEGYTEKYATLLPRFKEQGVTPAFRITLGGCTDGSCGPFNYSADSKLKMTSSLPTKASYTQDELRKVRAYCYAMASGMDAYWATLPGSGGRPHEYLVIGDPLEAGIQPDAYDALYKGCKQGIEDAVGSAATVIFAIPYACNGCNFAQFTYTQGIFQHHDAYDAAYIEAKPVSGKYQEYTIQDLEWRGTLLATLKLPIYFKASVTPNEQNLYGARLPLSLALSGIGTLIYDSLNGNVTGNGTHTWNATGDALSADVFHFTKIPDGTTGVEAILTEKRDKSSITLFNLESAQKKIVWDLGACSPGSTRVVGKNLDVTKPSFDGTLPPYSITTVEFNAPATCIAPIGTNSACTALVDCNDDPATGGAVHPGAAEICDNTIDDNCNGQVDEQPCQGKELAPPATIMCNYNGVCDAGEDNSCRDCSQFADSCPTNWTLTKRQGLYDIYTRAGERNNPEMLITLPVPGDCYTGAGGTAPLWMNTTSPRMLAYYNGGGNNIRIYVTPLGDRWLITGDQTASGSSSANKCWACADNKCATMNLEIPFSTTGCDVNAQCAPLGAKWYTPEDCCSCLSPDASGLCKNDALGCFGQAGTGDESLPTTDRIDNFKNQNIP